MSIIVSPSGWDVPYECDWDPPVLPDKVDKEDEINKNDKDVSPS